MAEIEPGPKRHTYRLKRKEEVAAGLRRIALGRAESALEALAGIERGDDPAAAIHSARKDIKKLRAVLRLARGSLGEELYRSENGRYRDATGLLSQSRDAEVKLDTLGALEERFGERLPVGPTRAWCVALERERDEIAAGDGDGETRIAAAIAAIDAGRERIPEWPLRGDSWKPVGAGLTRCYRRGRREMKRVRADPSAECVHEWRKRVKDLWYQLRIVRNAWPPVLVATVDEAHRLADLLGAHHDFAVLAEDLVRRPAVGHQEEIAALIECRQQELLTAALDLGARLFAEKPKAFGARLGAYWQTWRAATQN